MAKRKPAGRKKPAKADPKPLAGSKPGTVKVRLLSGRTGYGRRGDLVDYPKDEAELHAVEPFGTVEILTDAPEEPAPDEETEEAEEAP